MRNHRDSDLKWFCFDLTVGIIAVLFGYSRQNLSIIGAGPADWHPGAVPSALIFGVVFALTCFASGINGYHGRRPSWSRVLLLGVACTGIASISLISIFFLFLMQVGRVLIFETCIVAFVAIVSMRCLAFRTRKSERRKALLIRNWEVLIPGQMLDLLGNRYDIETVESSVCTNENLETIVHEWAEAGVDDVILGGAYHLLDTKKLFVLCWQNGIRLLDWNYFVEMNFGKLNVYDQNLSWLMELDQHYAHPAYSRAKRFIDVVVSGAGLILALPFFVVGAVLVFLDSGLPILFRQKRVGLGGECFTVVKFRTMVESQEVDEVKWAQKKDNRIRKIGRFLRNSRIDELPQLINVFKGDMSLVGPRPEWDKIAEEWNEKIPSYAYRSMVKPGLTGWAQINFGYAETQDEVLEKLSYDFYYIKHASVGFDLSILLKTFSAMFVGGR